VAGLNFAAAFLRADGRMRSDTPVSLMIEHLDHMIDRMGEDHVALWVRTSMARSFPPP
jgi:membrane dipeptidase